MQYRYVAYNLDDGIVKGQVEASSEAEVRDSLQRDGLKLLRTSTFHGLPSLESLFPSLFRPGTADLVQFLRQLSTIIISGGGILRALQVIEAQSHNRTMKRTLKEIRQSLDNGKSLSEAMGEHPKVFTPLFTSVVEVGESMGRLGPALEQVAGILEREHEAKQKAIRTLMYPVAIIGLSLVTLVVLMTVALPPLLDTFGKTNADIPAITKIAVSIVGQAKANFLQVLIGLGALVLTLSVLRRFERFRWWMEVAKIKAPILGSLIIAGEVARASRSIAMLLESGVALSEALHLSMSGAKNLVMYKVLADAGESLTEGHGLLEALVQHPILPAMFVELVGIGEESNSLQRTMNDAAEAYQKQVEERMDALIGILEPASTVIVGGIVAFIAFSMFVPIYSALETM